MISIPSYRMAPAKLKELKDQLKDILEKVFIRPSISSWDMDMMFLRKTDRSLRILKSIINIHFHGLTIFLICFRVSNDFQ